MVEAALVFVLISILVIVIELLEHHSSGDIIYGITISSLIVILDIVLILSTKYLEIMNCIK